MQKLLLPLLMLAHFHATACSIPHDANTPEYRSKSRQMGERQVRQFMADADEVFVGRWIDTRVAPEGELERTTYVFELVEAIKGRPSSQPTVFFDAKPGSVLIQTYCGPGFMPGMEYRLYDRDRYATFLVYKNKGQAIRMRFLERKQLLSNQEELGLLR